MKLELILKDIQDLWTRENFFRIKKFTDASPIIGAGLQLFDITVPKKDAKFIVKHGLSFIPADVIHLFTDGDYNFAFLYSEFDRDNIYINAHGPVRIRFLAGKFQDTKSDVKSPPFVAPGGWPP